VRLKKKEFSVDEDAPFGSIQEQVMHFSTSKSISHKKKTNRKLATQNLIDFDDTEEKLI